MSGIFCQARLPGSMVARQKGTRQKMLMVSVDKIGGFRVKI